MELMIFWDSYKNVWRIQLGRAKAQRPSILITTTYILYMHILLYIYIIIIHCALLHDGAHHHHMHQSICLIAIHHDFDDFFNVARLEDVIRSTLADANLFILHLGSPVGEAAEHP